MDTSDKIDAFLSKHDQWSIALHTFRDLLLKTELVENVKWGMPVYSLNGKNVVGMGAFKTYVGLWFFQGAFLTDPHNLLINAQDGKTKGMRQLRFASESEIDIEVLNHYILEAIENQKAGKEIKIDTHKPLEIPKELEARLQEDQPLQKSFSDLSLSKRREYAEYIQGAKRSETKEKRLQKILPMIRDGIGLSDKYRK